MYQLILNLIPQGILPRINVSQYDHGQTVDVTLYEGSTAYTLPSGATVTVSGTKADNTGFEYNCTTTGGLSFTIADQMTVFAGEVECELTIRYGNNRISTINFILDVERAALQDGVVISETDIPTLQQIPEYAAQAESSANLAHQWATGGGSDTPSASNNAKYWAQQAAQTDIGRATTVDYSTDQSPYSFRRCTHNAVYDKLVGISYVKNQLVQNGNFANGTTGWSAVTANISANSNILTLTATGVNGRLEKTIQRLAGHKYLMMNSVKVTTANTNINALQVYNGTSWTYKSTEQDTNWHNYYIIFNQTTDDNTRTYARFCQDNRTSGFDAIQVKNCMIVDLTLMFGTAIADKIYTMEQAEAGSGLAWIRQYGFLNDEYIEYNAGAIESSAPTVRKVVGFNVMPENFELGYYAPDGIATAATTAIRCKSYIQVIPNTTYYFKTSGKNGYVCQYDADKKFIGTRMLVIDNTFSILPNAKYIRVNLGENYGVVYNHDICINISGTKNGTYEPYKEVTYPLGGDTLRGVPQLVGDDLVADGDVKTSDGVMNSQYLEPINLGSLNWTKSGNSFVSSAISGIKTVANATTKGNMICTKYVVTYVSGMTSRDNKTIAVGVGNDAVVYVYDTAYSDAATFKAAMNGVYLLAEKATPTSSVSTPFTSPQVSLETEETDTICGHDSVVVDIPDWMQNEYFDDVRADASKVQGIEQAFQSKVEETNIAPVENGNTASEGYSVGSLIMRKGVLYKVISQISSGGTFTVDTNIQQTTLAEVIANM